MKILKWITSVVLLTGLTVTAASAATYYVDHAAALMGMSANNIYEATNPGAANPATSVVDPGPVGTSFTHTYEFNVTELLGLTAETFMNVSVGASSIANLVFNWGVGAPVALTDGAGMQTGPISFTRFLAAGLHTLTVTGDVIGNPSINTAYDFTILTTAVPVPAAIWLFGSAMVGFIGFGCRSKA